jgi:NAD(P)-dependent dehydrogenase (short-subunit alcohol dehydrogenase family)
MRPYFKPQVRRKTMILPINEAQIQREFFEHDAKSKPQHQERQPGFRGHMQPKPDCGEERYQGSGKLTDQVAIITGGDSGIGRAAAIAFGREGADVVIVYLNEHDDAKDTSSWVEKSGRQCVLHAGDAGDDNFCKRVVSETFNRFGRLDIVVNNAAEQHRVQDPQEITREQVERTFITNIFSFFSLTGAALKHMRQGGKIINVTSVVAYAGHDQLITYSTTKGAIVTYTRSMAQALLKRGIRVNAIAPGPVWTPLIPATFPAERAADFGKEFPMGRAAQPVEMAPAFVYLASTDSTFMTGQVLHLNGGVIVGA